MQLSHLDGDEILELDWRISGTVTSAGTLVRSDEFIFDETNDAHRWLTATANSRIKVRFIPTQWEHAALDRSLRPAPIMMARPGARLAGSQ